MKTTFDTSLDITAKVLTIGIAVVFIGIAFYPLRYESGDYGASFLMSGIFALIYGISFVYSPRSYELDENKLIINRPIGNVIINRSEIKSAFKVGKKKLRWSVRTFGVGGLFGYFGQFWNNEFGHMTWYATKMDCAVLIVTNANKKFVLTPDQPDRFLNELASQL